MKHVKYKFIHLRNIGQYKVDWLPPSPAQKHRGDMLRWTSRRMPAERYLLRLTQCRKAGISLILSAMLIATNFPMPRAWGGAQTETCVSVPPRQGISALGSVLRQLATDERDKSRAAIEDANSGEGRPRAKAESMREEGRAGSVAKATATLETTAHLQTIAIYWQVIMEQMRTIFDGTNIRLSVYFAINNGPEEEFEILSLAKYVPEMNAGCKLTIFVKPKSEMVKPETLQKIADYIAFCSSNTTKNGFYALLLGKEGHKMFVEIWEAVDRETAPDSKTATVEELFAAPGDTAALSSV
jgi:hypothetical protein